MADKLAMKTAKEDITKKVGSLQLCAGQEAGKEAVIHPMRSIFGANETESIFQLDAENDFSSVNWKVLLHNVLHLYQINPTYLWRSYPFSARLFIIGGKELRLQEDRNQVDLTAMASYASGLILVLEKLQDIKEKIEDVVFNDDLQGAGKLKLKEIWFEANQQTFKRCFNVDARLIRRRDVE